MEVIFGSAELMKCYQESERAIRRWGPDIGRRYIARIQALYAAAKFSDLFTVKSLGLHALKGERQGQYAMNLAGRSRLVIVRLAEDKVRLEEVTKHYGD
jgi:plasmid maintenance system killer protein